MRLTFLLQNVQTGCGGPRRRRHVVLQDPGVDVGVSDHLRRPQNRLRGQSVCQIAGKSHFYAAVGQRLYQDINLKEIIFQTNRSPKGAITYAGPEPLRAVMASNRFSVTCSQVPTDFRSFFVSWASRSVALLPVTKTEAPLRTRAGMLGITRTTRHSFGKY
jgi:hypothetical protein